ncbi:hypothetical protein AYL99_04383 [Fonsecaea erecta]|uniref:F-box domain-containing protein n=1 Tax=Fonsecaea erecta TaxID=1367422 RepID=A0A178ZQU3_9EURO|nr:hypothetical protein AYL99_04383 [Fonsecaea erecta]OAP62180.1 hypothetical protein AYL99_04383 [Fonsecaea erecta]
MDGACDGPDEPASTPIGRTSSVIDFKEQPPPPSVVHFLSDDHLNWREREPATFVNPFTPEESSSRKTSTSSDATAYLRPNAFAGHRDTLARLHFNTRYNDDDDSADSDTDSFATALTRQPSVSRTYRKASQAGSNLDLFYPQRVVDTVLQHLTFDEYKTMRLVCRHWHAHLPQPKFPGAYLLPREILKEVFSYLDPSSFDAARHTCKAWFLVSLDRKLLEAMLRASGCRAALATDLERMRGSIEGKRRSWDSCLGPMQTDAEDIIDKEWLCSKRLATESRLSPDWRGFLLPSDSSPQSRLSVIEEVDFSRILTSHAPRKTPRFTVSACGSFVLVVSGGDISVYSLCDPEQPLAPVVRLATGIEVLKVSMDTTFGRYSIAALLSGRIGMLWDLRGSHILTRYRNSSGETMSLRVQKDIHGPTNLNPSTLASVNLPFNSHETHAVEEMEGLYGMDDSDQVQDLLGIPIETRATAIYTDLGGTNDPPKSVAICPNRKCVAFGCRMGIELHWVDAVTGEHLNRWFPLAAPSNYLYFLPPRRGVDSRKKLRLISSAAGPVITRLLRSDSTPAKSKHWPTPPNLGRRQSLTRLFFGSLPFPRSAGGSEDLSGSSTPQRADEGRGVLRTVDCDHFYAIPVSDGLHLLFTDPDSGLVCLGSDAPLGGPTKLDRKIMFIPPGQHDRTPAPRCYAFGKALEWGLRLVVAYDTDQVVLYNIPSDVFERLQDQRSPTDVWDENSGVVGQSDLIMDSLMNRDESRDREAPEGDDSPAREPMRLDGSVIADVGDQVVDDIAVQSENGGLSVWLFYRDGLAELYSIYAPHPRQVQRRFVGENGLIWNSDNQIPVEVKTDTLESKGKERANQESKHVKWAGQGNQ